MSVKGVVHRTLGLFDLRVGRLSRHRRAAEDTRRVAEDARRAVEARAAAAEARAAAAEAALAEIEQDERRAREVTQLQPMAFPRTPETFFIKVKVDYPDIFRTNPPHYVYRPVEALFRAHEQAIERNARALAPHMYGAEMDGLPTARVNDIDPYWNNGMFERDDGRAVYAMTAHLKPRRIVEVGSGNSTKFFRKAITDHRLDCELICVDPVPRAEIKAVASKVIYQHIKDVDLSLFESLGDNDILFWDGSHITFNGTDTPHFYLTVLPLIRKNVYVHVHDVQLPYEYGEVYTACYYNEQYMLGTLLLNTPEWLPVLPVFWGQRAGLLRHGGASFWMGRRHLA